MTPWVNAMRTRPSFGLGGDSKTREVARQKGPAHERSGPFDFRAAVIGASS